MNILFVQFLYFITRFTLLYPYDTIYQDIDYNNLIILNVRKVGLIELKEILFIENSINTFNDVKFTAIILSHYNKSMNS